MPLTDPISLALSGMIAGAAVLGMLLVPVSRANADMTRALLIFLTALALVESAPPLMAAAPRHMLTSYLLVLPVHLLLAPAAWLYVDAATRVEGAQPPAWRHALPFALAYLAVPLPLVLAEPGAVRVELSPAQDWSVLDHIAGWGLVIVIAAWLVQLVWYGGACIVRLLEHRRRLRDHFADLGGRELRWLDLIGALVLVSVAQSLVLALVFDDSPAWLGRLEGLLTFALLVALILFALRQGQAFSAKDPSADPPTKRYANSALSNERAAQIATALRDVMARQQLYRESSLSLARLARAISTPPDYVTQTLNEVMGESFFDFVNRWRVEAACDLLATTDTPITTIALDVGYNSRSAFYRAFSLLKGATPSVYRAQRRAPGPTLVMDKGPTRQKR